MLRTNPVLEIDLTSQRIRHRALDSAHALAFLGGRGMNMATLARTLDPQVDALAPSVSLLFGVGSLVGTGFPSCARFNVSGRSPQTGILGDSNAGGHFGVALRRTGLDQIQIRGSAASPVYLWIDDDRIELRDAAEFMGLDTVEVTEALEDMAEGAPIRVATVGPAAERGVSFSGVFADRVRAAARTGMGTLMAAKGLKAIAVRGTGTVPIHDPARFRELVVEAREKILTHDEYDIRSRLGTTQLVSALQRMGGLPTRHFQSGTCEFADAVSGERIEAEYKVRSMTCAACPIHCSRYLEVDDPRFPGLSFEGPEYEPLAGFSIRIGNPDLPLALAAVDRCNRLGMDAITASEVIAWTMECNERGLLPRTQTGGLDISFGNGDAALDLLEMIAKREGFGDILADGVCAAANRLGVGHDLAMHSKGLELFQADVRAMKAYGLGNAVASRGADHLRSEPWFEFSGDREAAVARYGTPEAADRLSWKGKGRVVKDYEERAAISDALGICKNVYNNMEILDWGQTAHVLNAVLGTSYNGEDVRLIGERIVNIERLINARLGVDRSWDTLPRRFLEEPAGPPDSPSAGSVLELESMLEEYYAVRGWDQGTGLPTEAKLKALGLGDNHG